MTRMLLSLLSSAVPPLPPGLVGGLLGSGAWVAASLGGVLDTRYIVGGDSGGCLFL